MVRDKDVLQGKQDGTPLTQTYQLAAMAKMSRKPMNKNDSRLFAETRSVEKIIVLTSCPCAVPNPVRTMTPRQPPSGVLIGDSISAADGKCKSVCWRIYIIPYMI